MSKLLEELLKTKREIILQKEKQVQLEYSLIESLKDKSIPFSERLKTYLELPPLQFGGCAEYEELPIEIKYIVDIYTDINIIGDDQDRESLKFLLTKFVLKIDGSFNCDFLKQNSISENKLEEAIEKIFEKGFTTCYLY